MDITRRFFLVGSVSLFFGLSGDGCPRCLLAGNRRRLISEVAHCTIARLVRGC